MNYRKKRKTAMGFYVCTGLCLVAIGIAAIVSYMSIDTSPVKYENLPESVSEEKASEKPVNETQKPNNDANKVTAEEIKPTPIKKEEKDDEKEDDDEESSKEEEVKVIAQETAVSPIHFAFPAKANVIKGFSGNAPIYSETMRDFRVHNAVDYEGEIGMTVTSAGDGEITNIYKDAMLSNVVIIKHGKYHFYYCGLENLKVSIGDTVSLGQDLGTLGEIPCESVDVPHLHLEVYEKSEPINAESIIPK